MDIAKKNDSHIEKYNIEVLHKEQLLMLLYALNLFIVYNFYSIYKLFTFSLPTFGDNKTNTRIMYAALPF